MLQTTLPPRNSILELPECHVRPLRIWLSLYPVGSSKSQLTEEFLLAWLLLCTLGRCYLHRIGRGFSWMLAMSDIILIFRCMRVKNSLPLRLLMPSIVNSLWDLKPAWQDVMTMLPLLADSFAGPVAALPYGLTALMVRLMRALHPSLPWIRGTWGALMSRALLALVGQI